jgi:Sulfotransferase family
VTGPVYIGGATRSGKTLMRWLLASHPHLAISRRADMWPRFYARYGDLGQPENLDRCLEAMLARPQVAGLVTDPQQVRSDFACGSPTYGRLFALIQDQYAATCNKPRWGDLSGLIERFIDPVTRAYPEARILHLIRDPRDRHEAVTARAGPLRPGSAGRSAASWLRSARLARRNAAEWPDNYRIVRYETLVSRPEETMREVCSFLGEDYEPEMLQLVATRRYDDERAQDGGSPVSRAYVGHYRGRISPADVAFIQSVAGRPMDDFGYARERMPRGLTARARLALHWPGAFVDVEVDRLRALANRWVTAR